MVLDLSSQEARWVVITSSICLKLRILKSRTTQVKHRNCRSRSSPLKRGSLGWLSSTEIQLRTKPLIRLKKPTKVIDSKCLKIKLTGHLKPFRIRTHIYREFKSILMLARSNTTWLTKTRFSIIVAAKFPSCKGICRITLSHEITHGSFHLVTISSFEMIKGHQ